MPESYATRTRTVASAAGMVLLLLAPGPHLQAQSLDLSVHVGGGGGSETFFQGHGRAELELARVSPYVRMGASFFTQRCALYCNVPSTRSIDIAGGLSMSFGGRLSDASHLDVGGGLASWEGRDGFAEAELGVSVFNSFIVGLRGEIRMIGERARDDLLVRDDTLKLAGFFIGWRIN